MAVAARTIAMPNVRARHAIPGAQGPLLRAAYAQASMARPMNGLSSFRRARVRFLRCLSAHRFRFSCLAASFTRHENAVRPSL